MRIAGYSFLHDFSIAGNLVGQMGFLWRNVKAKHAPAELLAPADSASKGLNQTVQLPPLFSPPIFPSSTHPGLCLY